MIRTVIALLVVAPLLLLPLGVAPPDRLQQLLGAASIPVPWEMQVGVVVGPSLGLRRTRAVAFAVTFVHEMGHSVTAWLFGAQVHRFVIHPDSSGRIWHSDAGGAGGVVISLIGYVCPGFCGLSLILTTQGGQTRAWLAYAALVLLTTTVLKGRNALGFILGLTLAAFLGAALYLDQRFLNATAIALGVTLLIGGLYPAWAQVASARARRLRRDQHLAGHRAASDGRCHGPSRGVPRARGAGKS